MDLKTVVPPDELYRVARVGSPTRFSRINPSDAELSTAGNRYDVLGGGVLYAASKIHTCLAETLARFRPTPAMQLLLAEADPQEPHFMLCGGVPQDWRLQRKISTLALASPLPFLDVEDMTTLERLSRELAPTLISLGYEQSLDISDVRNRDRRLSRAISAWAYTAQDEIGVPRYSGLRYRSRVDRSEECWAIFDGTDVYETSSVSIEVDDPNLQSVANEWGLRVF